MRALLARLLLLLAACCPLKSFAQDAPPVQAKNNRPLSEFLKDLSDPSEDKRRVAAEALAAASNALQRAALRERLSPRAFKFVAEDFGNVLSDDDRVAQWRRELPQLLPPTVDYLRNEGEREHWDLVLELLVIADTDGAVLQRENKQLFHNEELRLRARWVQATVGLYTAPRDRSVLAPVVQELKTLSPAMRQRFDQAWRTKDEPDSELNSCPIVPAVTSIILAHNDRVQIELPQLAALLAKDQPVLLRGAALVTIVQLGEDALPLLAIIRQQLKDEDETIRYYAAMATHMIDPATDISALVQEARLQDAHLRTLNGMFEQSKNRRKIQSELIASDKPEQREQLDEGKNTIIRILQSHHQFFIRHCLRGLIEVGSAGQFARQDIEAVLQMPQLDDETRRLAGLAIKAIDGK